MIKKIDIQKFGLFTDYIWDKEIGPDPLKNIFKKVNIIYGRNYSGKTTLSRVFRCIEQKELHIDYANAKFTLLTDDDFTVDESNLFYPKIIRVYNTDFVKDNLSLLVDNDNGKIKTFALIGDKNKEILEEIENLQAQLGDKEKGGLEKEYSDSSQAVAIKVEALSTKRNEIEWALKSLANDTIKVNDNYFFITPQKRDYKITDIRIEINQILESGKSYILDDLIEKQYKNSLKEAEKLKIDKEIILKLPDLENHKSTVKELMQRKISVTKTINELANNGELQKWVKIGLEHHHSPNEHCAFCGNIRIGEDRWKQLKAHFSKDFEDITKDLNNEIQALKETRELYNSYFQDQSITKDLFYGEYHKQFDQIVFLWNNAVSTYKEVFNSLIELLEQRLSDIFIPKSFESELLGYPSDFDDIIKALNKLIKDNDLKTEKLFEQKQSNRKQLRFSLIDKFISEFEYRIKVENCEKLATEIEIDKKVLAGKRDKIETLKRKIKEKEDSFNDERIAARKINKHLNDFFGHDGVYFDVEDSSEEKAIPKSFKIKRGDEDARNLSEGECSLIAFCYFMAKIEDDLKDVNAKDNLIIYIDDPISSLDNNHIFFMFGLINTIIVLADKIENVRFHQLFISTHNLEFLKYLHRLSPFSGLYKSDDNQNMNHLLVEKRSKGDEYRSVLRQMPKHLRLNTTEYIYLFEQIYNIAQTYDDIENKIKYYEENYTLLYNIGNNMRRFMENFLSFKYAGENDPLYLLKDFFNELDGTQLNRASNEFSHLSWLEKGTTLLDIPEAERLAKLILKGIKTRDEFHFNSLCKKIGSDPNIVII